MNSSKKFFEFRSIEKCSKCGQNIIGKYDYLASTKYIPQQLINGEIIEHSISSN